MVAAPEVKTYRAIRCYTSRLHAKSVVNAIRREFEISVTRVGVTAGPSSFYFVDVSVPEGEMDKLLGLLSVGNSVESEVFPPVDELQELYQAQGLTRFQRQ